MKRVVRDAAIFLGLKTTNPRKPLTPDLKIADNEIVFLQIGKTAGTQIKFLAEQVNKAQAERFISAYGHNQNLARLPRQTPFFFSIRDPISRFKSAFYSRKRKGQPRRYYEWSPGERRAFDVFDHANDLAEALFLDTDLGRHAFWAMSTIGHISSHQFEWVNISRCVLEDREPIWIIRQEHLVDDFRTFLRRAQLSVDFDDLSINQDPVQAHRFDYSGVPELSDKARANLTQWYRRDIEFYKLCVHWMMTKEPESASA